MGLWMKNEKLSELSADVGVLSAHVRALSEQLSRNTAVLATYEDQWRGLGDIMVRASELASALDRSRKVLDGKIREYETLIATERAMMTAAPARKGVDLETYASG